jgi:hypothetical protein
VQVAGMSDSIGRQEQHIMTGRVVLFMLSAIASSLAGIIIVRKLDPTSYAAYQSMTKRVIQYVVALSIIYESWIIHDIIQNVVGVRRHVAYTGYSSLL